MARVFQHYDRHIRCHQLHLRAVVRTLAPASRRRAVTAWPIPLVPPVTSTRLPSNSCGMAVTSCAAFIDLSSRAVCVVRPANSTDVAASPAERLIQLNQSQQLVELGLDEAQLGGEGVGFVGQNFEITSNAAAVPQMGKARRILRGLEQEFFLNSKFPRLTVGD